MPTGLKAIPLESSLKVRAQLQIDSSPPQGP